MRKGIPAPNGAFRDWEVNFLTLVVASQVAWALDVAFVTALQALQTPWAAAWAIVSTGNCTPSQRVAMREAKAAYISSLRIFIKTQILYNTLISDAQIEQLGLKRRDEHNTPVPVPSTVPIVTFVPVFLHKVKIFFHQQPDAEGVSRRGKPKGVKFTEFAYSIDAVPASPDDCKGRGLFPRSQRVLNFEASQAGKKVYLFARFMNERGDGGEWTNRMEFMIP